VIIAQISDLHVRPRGRTAYGDVDTNAMLRRAIAAIGALQPRPDCVLVTGDLTDCGLDDEYTLLDEILHPLTMPVFVITGNHDRRDAMRRALGGKHGYLPKHGPFLDYVVDDFPVRLVGLDCVIPGETHGEIRPEQIEWLASVLQASRRPTVLMIHHPPFPTGVETMDRLGCRGGEALAALVARHPEIERVLSGHYHRPITVRWAGTIGFAAPSTAHQVVLDLRPGAPTRFIMEPPALAVHTWKPAIGITTHLVPIGDFGVAFDVTLDPDYPGVAVNG
jgi:3',5'-cyclic AMP phosphodiesterase CpdA